MRLGLIFSNDWELFGDGSGDYWEIQHRRLKQMLDAAAPFGARITVMAEIGQQWAHRRLGEREPWAREIADAWDAMLVETIRQGSDVQLHLHPQWIGARRWAGKWRLDFEHWALSSLAAGEISAVLADGKRYLETLLQPVRPTYRTVLFRAGAFCIEPAQHAISTLRDAGFLADSSVTKGLYDSRFYDYRNAPSHVLPWQVNEISVAREGNATGVVELPILATRLWDLPLLRKVGLWHYTRWLANRDRSYLHERDAYVRRLYPTSQRPVAAKRRGLMQLVVRAMGAVLRPHAISLDYDALPAPVFVDCVQRLLSDRELRSLVDTDEIVPVMALGHTKVVPDVENFQRMLAQLVDRLGDRIVFWSGQAAAEYWSSKLMESGDDAPALQTAKAQGRRVA
ncbi:MAG: hypothetical protein WD845_00775 [Pirellulales bacterium]